ncbi:MAG TPA: 6-hydroxycyclohex-1-ene-1-carbonyl-CoA dehydrogenase [Bacteroidia bacterium]|nr:6-hydroxycyclohex-1-ene-1-carbonyl-CoA dehydrogenase [Bacteroidia bacterium]MBP7714329.1 6-hydroxycyclohex-1-ene-1-carbonyl-CoA dehydrogenase [Bacteroidia bacterium]HQW17612.1 6-hydroxycyclohex-1-ene-1-carbonyl-CoA dehydrogenase [Bacteroidia bacterium]HQW48909.1 6-hydroxycyclohex-1-ene-1-carbonyl-CoA dehydrogenase [Bacteroidia bacterium]HQX69925.1 6-hydroxycyclohex-1-ene-1-carbonyl-CoA dehydrogenase [Bacteroidia bacterium]
MSNEKYFQWQMTELNKEFKLTENFFSGLAEGEVWVKVAGCGVCHTDISFWHHGVQTKHALPLTLGHEISGVVVKGDAAWLGKKVIIPAVLPCGECELCRKGRSNICRKQLMPGNDFHGGFASHIKVPSKYLCPVPDEVLKNYSLEQLSVIADAISTPYQVVKKSELEAGDLAIVIGVGGVGVYGALIAKIFGAKVIALDISDEKLEMAKKNGIDATLNIKGLDVKAVKEKVKELSKELKASNIGWKIFEISGTKAGQDLAFNLITFASTLSIVGFTMDKAEVRLSNLMAFDAKLIGTWGCRAELYPEVLELVASGKLKIASFVETFPMSKINEVFANTLEHKYTKRSVLVADFN